LGEQLPLTVTHGQLEVCERVVHGGLPPDARARCGARVTCQEATPVSVTSQGAMMVGERGRGMRAAELLPHESKPAPGDLRFVQAFVNTLDVETGRDQFAEPAGLEAWLRTHGGLGEGTRLGPEDVRAAARFREALRTLLTEGSESDPEALAVL